MVICNPQSRSIVLRWTRPNIMTNVLNCISSPSYFSLLILNISEIKVLQLYFACVWLECFISRCITAFSSGNFSNISLIIIYTYIWLFAYKQSQILSKFEKYYQNSKRQISSVEFSILFSVNYLNIYIQIVDRGFRLFPKELP